MKYVLPLIAVVAVASGAIWVASREDPRKPEPEPPAEKPAPAPTKEKKEDFSLTPRDKPILEKKDESAPKTATTDEWRARLAQHEYERWKSYYDKENERRIAELRELLDLSEGQLKLVTSALTLEREEYDVLWKEMMQRRDPAWVKSEAYAARIAAIVSPTDIGMETTLDEKQLQAYKVWRKKYNRGRYFLK